jgi:hypothetical protein
VKPPVSLKVVVQGMFCQSRKLFKIVFTKTVAKRNCPQRLKVFEIQIVKSNHFACYACFHSGSGVE